MRTRNTTESRMTPLAVPMGYTFCPMCALTERRLGLRRNSTCWFSGSTCLVCSGTDVVSRTTQDTIKTTLAMQATRRK